MKNILAFACILFLLSTFTVGCTPQDDAKKTAVPPAEAKLDEPKQEASEKTIEPASDREPIVKRKFSPMDQAFHGNGISYGPYRKDQRPGGAEPTKDQIREDLKLLAEDNWEMIRMYGTEPFARNTCEVIREDKLNIKVMVGAWVQTEKGQPDAATANQGQVDRAIKLANEFPEIVTAVSVGNETQVFWSAHKVEQATLINYIRQVRDNIKQPVTIADDFKFWKTDDSKPVAAELDFIVTHIYAMWLGEQLENAVSFTKAQYKEVCAQHPDHLVIIGEAGWATQKAEHGDQGKLIKGTPGESEQKQFFADYTSWLRTDKIGYFYFEAFDEPWKGGEDPAEVEKHWGLFREDRTRKPAIEK